MHQHAGIIGIKLQILLQVAGGYRPVITLYRRERGQAQRIAMRRIQPQHLLG
jgi:hypothetical protein